MTDTQTNLMRHDEYTSLQVWIDAVVAEDGVEASPELEINVHYRHGHEAEAKGLLVDAFVAAYNRIGATQ
jgi:hypothetical protein